MLSIIQIPQDSSRDIITASQYEALTVVQQVERAFSPGHRLGALIGTLVGGFVPLASYILIHEEAALTSLWLLALVLGALLFSVLSVFGWAEVAFHSRLKAAGFCVLCEGTMVLSRTEWLALAALGLLVFINVSSCACALQIGQEIERDAPNMTPSFTPAVNVTVNALQSNVPPPEKPASRSQSRAASRSAAAERSRRYRQKKRASQTVTMES